jgi:carbon monoxide dehydrogenase subunit G
MVGRSVQSSTAPVHASPDGLSQPTGDRTLKKSLIAAAAIAATAASTPAAAYEFGYAGWAQKPGITLGGGTAADPPPGLYSFNQVFTYQANIVGPGAPNVGGVATPVHAAVEASGLLWVPGWTFLGATYDAVIVQPWIMADVALTGPPTPERADGVIKVRLGPIAANFHGAARIERNPAGLSGRITGIGIDQRSRSTTRGEIRYQLVGVNDGRATRIDLSIGYSLTGVLAQIARPGLVGDLAARLTADFARNLEARLAGLAPEEPAPAAQSLNGAALLIDLMRARVREFVQRVFRT